MEFEWDSENRKHIARNGIAPEEAEQAVAIEPLETAVQQHESEQSSALFWAHHGWPAADHPVYRAAREDPGCDGL
jgi:hypothetical protein